MHRFPGIEGYLRKGYLLDVSATRSDRAPDGFWIAHITRRDGKAVAPRGIPGLHLMLTLVELEHAITKSRIPPFRRPRHSDSVALSLLRHIDIGIVVSYKKDTFSAYIYEKTLLIPGMTLEADSAITALLETISLAMNALASAHQAKFLGH